MKINIAGGRGPMGRVHKPVFEAAGHKVIISGRKTFPSLEEAVKKSDLTIVSVPISVTASMIKKLAPYCKAIMDFTGVKKVPVETMLSNSFDYCEVAGLHPLYGEVDSIKGKTVVYCQTERTGEKCLEVLSALKNSGAIIKEVNPEYHDKVMELLQNSRAKLLEGYSLMLADSGIDIRDLYELAPPPTKILLDLIARQIDSKNDQLYKDMREHNPYGSEIDSKLIKNLHRVLDKKIDLEYVRDFFATELKIAQERAKDLFRHVR